MLQSPVIVRTPSAGQVLGGKYRLLAPLGKGGLGAVWRAEHLTLRSPVALKLIDPVHTSDAEAIARFSREARAAAALRSAHVVQILDYGVDAGVPFIAMELLEGESLEARLLRERRLTPAATARLLKHLARAMTRAHEVGVVHRDLKPGNIFLVPNDDEEIAKVLDFGVAKTTTVALGTSMDVGATPAGALIGTAYYMSPEQAQGEVELDYRTDLWSMGVIAYECLLGEVPFDAHGLTGVLTKICASPLPVPSSRGLVPAGFDAWFARACARNPQARFQSARELAEAFERLCARATPPAARPAAAVEGAPAPTTPAVLGANVLGTNVRRAAPHLARYPSTVAPLAAAPERRPWARASSVGADRDERRPSRYRRELVAAALVSFPLTLATLYWLAPGGARTRSPSPAAPAKAGGSTPRDVAPGRAARHEPRADAPEPQDVVLPAAHVDPPAPRDAVLPAPPRPAPTPDGAAAAMRSDEQTQRSAPAPSTFVAAPNGAAARAPATPPASTGVASEPQATGGASTSPAAKASSTPRASTRCDPPWWLDATGIRRVKPECL